MSPREERPSTPRLAMSSALDLSGGRSSAMTRPGCPTYTHAGSAAGRPAGVALRQVRRAGAGRDDGAELADLPPHVEVTRFREPVQHGGHPVGEVLGPPHPRER